MPRKIALVGTHPSGQGAPFHDPSWEIFGVSARAGYFSRANRWYELHRIDGTFEKPAEAESWRKALAAQCAETEAGNGVPCPIKMIYPEPGLGHVVPYPHERIAARFGTFFMTSSFAWMMAEVIDEIAPRGQMAPEGSTIGVWGVEMEYGTEYTHQRAGFRHFLALADELGFTVLRRPAGGLIYEPVPYPMWQDDPVMCKLIERNKEAEAAAAKTEIAVHQTRELIAHNRGKQEAIQMCLGDDMTPEKAKERLEKLGAGHDNLMLLLAEQSKEHVYWKAIDSEQKFWLDYYKP